MGNTTFINKLDFSNFLEKDSQETRYQKSNNENSLRGLILMGKTGRPSRIIRSGKPAKCPKCTIRHFLIFVNGYPSNEVID